MKRLIKFIRTYILFSIGFASALVALVLELDKHKSAAHIILAITAIAETLPLVWAMWKDFRDGSYGIDLLAITAIVASVALKQYWAAIVVVLMLTGGQSLEDYAERRAQSELNTLLERAPQTANVIRKGKEFKVKVSEIKVGDKIVIKAGEITPVDAVVTDSRANFDEASITGESLPQFKEVGSSLLSGSINLDGVVTAKALSKAEDSQYQQIIKLVRSAAASQAPFVRLADRYSLPFSIMAYAVALAVWSISGHAIRFLEVIIVATPCPLLLAAPIALISGMTRASRYGVLVKTGSSLEKLAEARTIVFDKTGTLTKGDLEVSEVKSLGKLSSHEILKLAASLEQNSNHVLAKAITIYASKHKVKLDKVKHLDEIAGLGIKANIKGSMIAVGNIKLMEELNISLPSKSNKKSVAKTIAYVAVDQKIEGLISFADELREDVEETLSKLHKLGIKDLAIITGDNAEATNAIASQLSIDNVYANSLPADKLNTIYKFKKRPVIFVGDGVNDAPVLTAADIGIAMGAKGSTAASESADIVIMLDDISRVGLAVEIAKKTFSIARQSILIGIGLSVVLMLIFATGKFEPLYGAVLQELVDVVAIFNALRAHNAKLSGVY